MTSDTQHAVSTGFPLVIPTSTSQPTARLVLRNDLGQVVQQWLVKQNKCTLGSAASCSLRCTEAGIAAYHALLVIGARQTFVRALAPKLTRDGVQVNELLLSDENGSFEIAGHRFELSRPGGIAPSSSPNEQVASERRLRFTLARPFVLQNRSPLGGEPQGATSPGGPNPTDNYAAPWIAKLIQAAIEPLECQLHNALEPMAELQAESRRQRRWRRKRLEAKRQRADQDEPAASSAPVSDEDQWKGTIQAQLGAIQEILSEVSLGSSGLENTSAIVEALEKLQANQADSHQEIKSWKGAIQQQVDSIHEALAQLDRNTFSDSLSAALEQVDQRVARSLQEATGWKAEVLEQLSELRQTLAQSQAPAQPAAKDFTVAPPAGLADLPRIASFSAPTVADATEPLPIQSTDWKPQEPEQASFAGEEFAEEEIEQEFVFDGLQNDETYDSSAEVNNVLEWLQSAETEPAVSAEMPAGWLEGFDELGTAAGLADESWSDAEAVPASPLDDGYPDQSFAAPSGEDHAQNSTVRKWSGAEKNFSDALAPNAGALESTGLSALSREPLTAPEQADYEQYQNRIESDARSVLELDGSPDELVEEAPLDEAVTQEDADVVSPYAGPAVIDSLAENLLAMDDCDPEDNDSVENYMRDLLARMRGAPEERSDLSSPAQPQALLEVSPLPTPWKPNKNKSTSSLPAEERIIGTTSEASQPSAPEAPLPRELAPENSQKLTAMRELANTTARSAIHKSTRKRYLASVALKMSIAIIGLVVAIVLIVINGFSVNIGLVATFASLVVAAIWGYDALTGLKPLLESSFVLNPNVGSSQEPDEPLKAAAAPPAETMMGPGPVEANPADDVEQKS